MLLQLSAEETLLNSGFATCFHIVFFFFCWDLQYAKLAISLRVPGGGKKKAAAAPQGGASGAPAANEEEDEYEGGLC